MSNIRTHHGIIMDPICARDEEIQINDIAHALSLLCRANGHFPHFYSVAQHCLNCMEEARARGYSKKVQLGCLLHDASEAYLSDVIRPIKPHLTGYYEIAAKLENQIYAKWLPSLLTDLEKKQITEIDDALLYHEFFSLTGHRITETAPSLLSTPIVKFVEFREVETRYLECFEKLTK